MKEKSQQKNALVNLVKGELFAKKWKAADLVKKSGVNQGTISRFLSGCVNVKVENIYKILYALNLLKLKPESLPEQIYNSDPMWKHFKEVIEENVKLKEELAEFKKPWSGSERRKAPPGGK